MLGNQTFIGLSCLMEIDGKGNVIGHRIAETLIQVDRRMTYTAVNAIVTDRDPDVMEEYGDFVPMFDLMKELADILRERRKKRGSIDFDFPESKIILDEKGRPVDIKPYERNAATKIIEDFMLIGQRNHRRGLFLAGASVFIPYPRLPGSGKNEAAGNLYQ